jgi:PAS domain S-box-containing protein
MPRQALTKLKPRRARVTRKDLWQLFQAVVTAVSQARTVRDALQAVLDLVCEYTAWLVGHVYLLDDTDANRLPSSRIWSVAVPARFDAFRSVTEAGSASQDTGLAGLVLSSGKPAWTIEVASDLDLPRARAATACGLRSAIAFPILVRAEVAGVLEFFSTAAVKPDDHLLAVMGSIVAVLGGALERDRTGKDLWRSEHFATTVLASVGEGVIVYDRQLRYRIWNRFMEELTGMPPEQVLGRRAFDVFPHLVEQGVDKILQRALAGETVISPDTPYRVPATGKTDWVVGTYGPHLSPNGRIIGVVGIVRDITARKRVEDRLQQSEERFRTLIEHSPNTIALLGADGSFVEAPVARSSPNGAAANPLGRHVFESLHPDDHDTVKRLLDDLVGRPGASAPLLLRVRHVDGSWRWLEGTATNLLAEPLVKAVFLNYRDVTERKRAFDEIRERAALMDQFMRLSETLDETLAEDEVVQAVAQGAQILSGTDRVSVYLWRPDGTSTCAWSHGISDAHIAFVLAHHLELPGVRVARDDAEAKEILWNRAAPGIRALIVSDMATVPPQNLIYRLAQTTGHRAMAVWPLPHKRRVTGVLVSYFDRERSWSRAEQEVFQAFCWEAGTALENARLYSHQAERTKELEAFFRLSKQLRTSSTVEEMYPIIVERAKELLRAGGGTLSLVDPTRQTFTRVYCAGIEGETKGSTFPVAGSRSGRVIRSGTPYVTEDFTSEPLSPTLDPAPYRVLGPAAIVPVRSEQETIGTLAIGRLKEDQPRPFSEAEIRMLEGVAEIGGTAIQRARLHHNLEEAYLQIVVALAGAVDARDTYTSDHSERMAHWAETMAQAMGCDEDEVQDIRRAARLHDIGKIGIPDSILLKPMALSETEWAVMRRHPLIGADILMSVQRMRGVAALVRHHQERWDGTGYPDALNGEEIPLGARILAVVDAYSAIIDERPYKHARTHAEAIAELRRCSGTQFDPRVVEVFCQVVEGGREGSGASRGGQG